MAKTNITKHLYVIDKEEPRAFYNIELEWEIKEEGNKSSFYSGSVAEIKICIYRDRLVEEGYPSYLEIKLYNSKNEVGTKLGELANYIKDSSGDWDKSFIGDEDIILYLRKEIEDSSYRSNYDEKHAKYLSIGENLSKKIWEIIEDYVDFEGIYNMEEDKNEW